MSYPKKAFSFLFFSFFVLNLFSQAQAVQLTGNFSLEASCSRPAAVEWDLINDSSSAQTFAVYAEGPYANWVNSNGQWIGSNPLQVRLAAGQGKTLYSFVHPQSCKTKAGAYAITLSVKGTESVSKTVTVRVLEEAGISLNLSPGRQDAEKCERKEYSAEVSNNSGKDEFIEFLVEGQPLSWFSLSSSSFLLKQGETKTLQFSVQAPCTESIGEKQFMVSTRIRESSIQASVFGFYNIVGSQPTAIDFSQALSGGKIAACNDKESGKTIVVRNVSSKTDEVKVRVLSPGWVSVDNAPFSLAPGESKSVSLKFSPSGEAEGSYDLKVEAVSSRFASSQIFTLPIALENCLSLKAEAVSPQSSFCLGNPGELRFRVSNNGSQNLNVKASVSGIAATVNPETFALSSNSQKEVAVSLDLGQEVKGNKIVVFKAEADGVVVQERLGVSVENCLELDVDFSRVPDKASVEAKEKNVYPVIVKNLGSKAQSVNVSVRGPDWVYFIPDSFEILPLKSQSVFVYVAPPFETRPGNYSTAIVVSSDSGFTARKSADFNVSGGLYVLGSGADEREENGADVGLRLSEIVVEVSFQNDSNDAITVFGLSAVGFDANFDFDANAPAIVGPDSVFTSNMRVSLPSGTDAADVNIPVRIVTSDGNFTRNYSVPGSARERFSSEDENKSGVSSLSGLFSGESAILIGLLVLVVLGVVGIYFMTPVSKPKAEEPVSEPEATQKEPKKKPAKKARK